MARFVKMAAIPGRPLAVREPRDYEACVQEELAYWQEQLAPVLLDKPDFIVTPENCDRPLGMSRAWCAEYYAVRGDRVRALFMEAARTHHVNIAYAALQTLPDGTHRNAIQFINRSGALDGAYYKQVLVIEEHTEANILYGRETTAIQTDFARVCGAICFDLNFDEPLKATAAQKPELVVFSSAYHGGIMQAQWAYQCRAYFISCVSGTETANIINPVGEVVAESSYFYKNLSTRINLDYQVVHLDHNPEKLACMKRRYGDAVEIRTPYGLGCALLTHHGEGTSMLDIVQEFELELWADYYARSMAARYLPGRMEA